MNGNAIETPLLINIPGVPDFVAMTWLAMIFLSVLAFAATRRLSPIPGTLQNVVEFFLDTFTHMLESIMGPRGAAFVPFLGSLFLLILTGNIMGLVPGLRAPTANLNTTAALALVVFVVSHVLGLKEKGLRSYVRHYTGDIWYAAPLMLFVHVIGELARPFSLAIRLFANMMSDDLSLAIILTILPLIFRLVLPLFLPPLLIIIDAFVAVLQAMVFVILSAIYISQLAGYDEETRAGEPEEAAAA